MALVRDRLIFTALRIISALGWPTWLLCLIGVVVVPVYCVKRLREEDKQ